MTDFKYKEESIKYTYEVIYLDKIDDKCFAYVDAYSDKQARYMVKKLYPNCVTILKVTQLNEIPNPQGK